MKKSLSLLMSAALGLSAMCTPLSSMSAYADSVNNENNVLVVFGDSIASGYGLSSSERSYAQICADYLDWSYINYAESGERAMDLYELISADDSIAAQAAGNAEAIVISIGGNDIIRDILKYSLDYAAAENILADGKTADDIPQDPTPDDAKVLLDQDKLMSYLSSNPTKASAFGSGLKQYLVGKSGDTGTVQDRVIPDIEKSISYLSSINPEADIIVQTVYQPIQFSQEYWNARFGEGAPYQNQAVAMKLFRNIMVNTMDTFRSELEEMSVSYNFKIADVYQEFTSVEKQTVNDQGYAHYFTNIQKSGDARDIHPNQKGHLAIAAAVLEQIGELKDTDSSSLLRKVYNEVTSDGIPYPEMAYKTYKLVAGNDIAVTYKLGDVTEDNVIDSDDASYVLAEYARTATSKPSEFSDAQKKAADVTNDNIIDSDDASLILSYYAYCAVTDNPVSIEEFLKGVR